MTNSPLKQKQKNVSQEQEPELKGTFVFVLGIGAFILISWFIVFALFVAR